MPNPLEDLSESLVLLAHFLKELRRGTQPGEMNTVHSRNAENCLIGNAFVLQKGPVSKQDGILGKQ